MKHILYTIALLICFASCQREELLGTNATNQNQGVRVYISTTDLTEVETRAAINDVSISEVDILVFDGTDEQTSKLTEHVVANILPNGEIYALLTHTKSDEPRYIALLANIRGVITNAGTDALEIGSTLAQVRKNMELYPEMVELIGSEGYNIKTLPKTSELIEYPEGINYSTTLGTNENPIRLKNRMTRISAVSHVVNLSIEAISLHQAPHSGGQLHYVAGAPLHDAEGRIDYYGTADQAQLPAQNQSIYVFSTKQSEDPAKEMKLVVKGRYETDEQACYYCIRFQQKDDVGFKMIDFKPNHHYTVNLQKVSGRGYPSLQEAIRNECSNVEVDITDDSSLGEILTNGQYMLATSNSDCQIYGDLDPEINYPITRLMTNAPSTAEIVLSSSTNDIEIVTLASAIPRDKTEIPIEVKFKNQFVSGTVTIRIGNLTRVVSVSITLDPPFIKVDDVLDAKVISGYPEKTIALAKTAYNETVNPYLGDNIFESKENNVKGNPLYIHFNKITMGDTPRFGEVLLSHHSKITTTRIITYQRPWVEMGGVRWSTGNLVIGWHPNGTLRYKIGAAVEYGVQFANQSMHAIAKRRVSELHAGYAYIAPESVSPNSVITRTPATYVELIKRISVVNDPCLFLSTTGVNTWHTASVYAGNKITKIELAAHNAPNGYLDNSGKLFWVLNGMTSTDGSFFDTDRAATYNAANDGLYSALGIAGGGSFVMNRDAFDYGRSIRCLRGDNITSVDEVGLLHTYPNRELKIDPKYAATATITTPTPDKFLKLSLNRTTGIVSIQAKYDYSITELDPNYATITINANETVKTIKVHYEPIVYAEGDITLRNGRYEIGAHTEHSNISFLGHSNYALSIAPWAAWSESSVYYIPNADPSKQCDRRSGVSNAVKNTFMLKGDPCHSVYDPNGKKWKTIFWLNNHIIAFTPNSNDGFKYVGGVWGYESPYLRHKNGTPVFFCGKEYRWAMPMGNAFSTTMILDEHAWAGSRWNTDNNIYNFRVRCERDFEREQIKIDN